MTAVLREREGVTPLELFFDLVFVLALTQCTALMAETPTWEGLAKGMLVLGVLWWCWVGYAWLTSVVDPEEGIVRLVIFAAMAGLLVAALCVPDVFDDTGLLFACAYAVVRAAHIALFVLASRDDPALRKSTTGLAVSTALGSGLLVVASFADGTAQGALWALALALDMGGPLLFGQDGWKLMPAHFAERHGLIVIIALGESIVAIGVGAEQARRRRHRRGRGARHRRGRRALVAVLRRRRARRRAPAQQRGAGQGAERHRARLVLAPAPADGRRDRAGRARHEEDARARRGPAELVPAVALFGGTAVYLLAHVAFRWRNIHTLNRQRLACSVLLVALVPLGVELPSLATPDDPRGDPGGLVALRDAALRRGAQPAAPEARARAH